MPIGGGGSTIVVDKTSVGEDSSILVIDVEAKTESSWSIVSIVLFVCGDLEGTTDVLYDSSSRVIGKLKLKDVCKIRTNIVIRSIVKSLDELLFGYKN